MSEELDAAVCHVLKEMASYLPCQSCQGWQDSEMIMECYESEDRGYTAVLYAYDRGANTGFYGSGLLAALREQGLQLYDFHYSHPAVMSLFILEPVAEMRFELMVLLRSRPEDCEPEGWRQIKLPDDIEEDLGLAEAVTRLRKLAHESSCSCAAKETLPGANEVVDLFASVSEIIKQSGSGKVIEHAFYVPDFLRRDLYRSDMLGFLTALQGYQCPSTENLNEDQLDTLVGWSVAANMMTMIGRPAPEPPPGLLLKKK